ncbi:MAG TPA: hypothetical protein PKE54_14925 [Candidatus Obscuribacter sp.]|nr:hypothetical protein [Candidatus Obscuribacter sp.]
MYSLQNRHRDVATNRALAELVSARIPIVMLDRIARSQDVKSTAQGLLIFKMPDTQKAVTQTDLRLASHAAPDKVLEVLFEREWNFWQVSFNGADGAASAGRVRQEMGEAEVISIDDRTLQINSTETFSRLAVILFTLFGEPEQQVHLKDHIGHWIGFLEPSPEREIDSLLELAGSYPVDFKHIDESRTVEKILLEALSLTEASHDREKLSSVMKALFELFSKQARLYLKQRDKTPLIERSKEWAAAQMNYLQSMVRLDVLKEYARQAQLELKEWGDKLAGVPSRKSLSGEFAAMEGHMLEEIAVYERLKGFDMEDMERLEFDQLYCIKYFCLSRLRELMGKKGQARTALNTAKKLMARLKGQTLDLRERLPDSDAWHRYQDGSLAQKLHRANLFSSPN